VSDAELWAAWRLWMAVAGVIVLIAAALLVTIWLTARRILAEAHRALAAAERIQAHTQVIWALESTNASAGRIHATVDALAGKTAALADALDGTRAGRKV
jgi:sensor histidine kinase regulating citrate/malate metabolism